MSGQADTARPLKPKKGKKHSPDKAQIEVAKTFQNTAIAFMSHPIDIGEEE